MSDERDADNTTIFYNKNKDSASTMGILGDVSMEYNRLFVLFYTGYLVALWLGAWFSQRVEHKHFMTGSLLLWAPLIGVHLAVKSGRQMMAMRFLLGIVTFGSMANVWLTMVAYKLIIDDNTGTLAGGINSWKWLHIICTLMTFTVFVPPVIFLPNPPLDAKWLSTEEKVHTIEIIREIHAGITNSTFKWSQVRDSFTDLKSWLFIFHIFFNELPKNTSQKLPLIIVGFGFTAAESALLGTGYTCAFSYIPCFFGSIFELAAPSDNKVTFVVGTQISTFKPSYLLGLNWAGSTTAGHAKKLTLVTSCNVAASVANIISPERENRRRGAPVAAETVGSCDSENEAIGTESEIVKIGERDMDKTDRENLGFVYPL
ncbi:hypothetical protein BDW69DRAFT_199468 [Aspergillus filifer]